MPTDINFHIKLAKTHAIELNSNLSELAKAIKTLSEDVVKMKKNKLSKDVLLEISKNIQCMASDISFMAKELEDRVGNKKWPESFSDL